MTEEDPAAAQRHAFQMDAAALSEFLREQLFFDAIAPQLATAVRVRTETAIHSAFTCWECSYRCCHTGAGLPIQ